MMKNILIIGFDKTSNGGIASVVKTFAEFFKDDDAINYSFIKTTYYKDKSGLSQILILLNGLIKYVSYLTFKKVDIIHIHASYGNSFYRKLLFFVIAKIFRKKIIFHIHSSKFYEFYLKSNRLIKFVITRSNLVIVLNKDWYSKLKEKYPAAKIMKLYNPIKTEKSNGYSPKTTREYLKFLFVGFYIKEKGILDLLEVAKSYKESTPVKFIFCGKGPLSEEIQKEAQENSNIINMGWIDGKVKTEIFNDSDILILPSYNEGLPISILEAMKFSLPVVSTNIAGIPEQVEHNFNGYLFTPGDIEGLKKIIDKIITLNQQEIDNLRKNSFLSVSKFSVETVSMELKTIYENI